MAEIYLFTFFHSNIRDFYVSNRWAINSIPYCSMLVGTIRQRKKAGREEGQEKRKGKEKRKEREKDHKN